MVTVQQMIDELSKFHPWEKVCYMADSYDGVGIDFLEPKIEPTIIDSVSGDYCIGLTYK